MITTPDGGTWQMTYGVSGLAQRVLPSGTRQVFKYLPGGMLHTVDFVTPAALKAVARHEYRYDGLGRVVRATVTGLSTVERRFDSLGRLIRETAAGQEVRLRRDDFAGWFEVVLPDGRVERTTLDAADRPTALTLEQAGTLGGLPGTTLVQLTYAGTSRLHAIRFANGVRCRHGYDAARRLVVVEVHRGSELVEVCRYCYDARDRRALIEMTGPPSLQRWHTFDAADRLTATASGLLLPQPLTGAPETWTQALQDQRVAAASAAAAQQSVAYGLTPADDRTIAAGQTYTYSAGHRLTGAGAEKISHAADGTRSADGDHHYDVDALGRVTAIRNAGTGAVVAEFEYDGLSRVYKGRLSGTLFQRAFLGADWVHEQRAAGTIAQRTLHPGNGAPLLWHDAAGSVALAGDGLLNTLAVFDAAGAVLQRHRFDAFGLPTWYGPQGQPLPPGAAPPPVFGRMPWQESLGLYETPARLYHPGHGQFLAPDPHGYADSPNPYAYVGHNPVDYADPTGMDKQPSFNDQRVQQMWHGLWDSYVDTFYNWPWHIAALAARITGPGRDAQALGYDLGAPLERIANESPLRFGPPQWGPLKPSYEEHHFGGMIFFNALAAVGPGFMSGPRITAEAAGQGAARIPRSAGAAAATDTSVFWNQGEWIDILRGGWRLEPFEAQAYWFGRVPRYERGGVVLREFRWGNINWDNAIVDRWGNVHELQDLKWGYSYSITKGRQDVADGLVREAIRQTNWGDEVGVPVVWIVPEKHLQDMKGALGKELAARIVWRTYDFDAAQYALRTMK